MTLYPDGHAARDKFVVERRGARPAHDPWRAQGLVFEDELTRGGSTAQVATLFLTGRECPWRCAMCDLWTHTTTTDTPRGSIAAQVAAAAEEIALSSRRTTHIKLYNAGSFFDPRAVPETDYDTIAAHLFSFERIIVESHPLLVGGRTVRFRDALNRHAAIDAMRPALEVAMGLETANPEALDKLNKRMTLDDFASASDRLLGLGLALRVFVLVSPPFIAHDDQDEWLMRSVDFAVDCGASVVSLIPARGGNGTMETLASDGLFAGPSLSDLERSLALGLESSRIRATGTRVFADLWDLDRFSACAHCLQARRTRLRAMNLAQHHLPDIVCLHCATERPA